VDAPLLRLSSSYIRKCIKEGKSYRYMTPDAVYEYLEETPIYKNLLKL